MLYMYKNTSKFENKKERRALIKGICVLCVLSQFSHIQLCDPMDCRPPGSSVHGVLQARILEWVAMPSSRGSSQPWIEPGSPALQVGSLPSEPPWKPNTGRN